MAGESFILATDLADYLVGKGVPFREAHGALRELCDYCESHDKELQGLTLEEYHRFSLHFGEDVYGITAKSAAAARDNVGGTAPNRVSEELTKAKELMEANANGL